jgi:hypothetical protein
MTICPHCKNPILPDPLDMAERIKVLEQALHKVQKMAMTAHSDVEDQFYRTAQKLLVDIGNVAHEALAEKEE